MAWEENPRICLHMQLIAILSRTGVRYIKECAFYINKSMHSRQRSVHGIKEGSESTI